MKEFYKYAYKMEYFPVYNDMCERSEYYIKYLYKNAKNADDIKYIEFIINKHKIFCCRNLVQ